MFVNTLDRFLLKIALNFILFENGNYLSAYFMLDRVKMRSLIPVSGKIRQRNAGIEGEMRYDITSILKVDKVCILKEVRNDDSGK